MPNLQSVSPLLGPLPQPAPQAAPLTQAAPEATPQVASDQLNLSPTQPTPSTASVSVSFEVQSFIHKVKRGDNLSKLAERYLGDADKNLEIFKANRNVMRNPDDLAIGTQLRIPLPPGMKPPVNDSDDVGSVQPISPDAPHSNYTVRRGDNLSSIALDTLGDSERYMEIFKANRHQLKDPDALQPGMVLHIPISTKPNQSAPVKPQQPVQPQQPQQPVTTPVAAPVDASGLNPRAKQLFSAMQNYQSFYAERGNVGRSRTTPAQMHEIARELDSASTAFGVDPKMMLALYAHESGGINPRARSHTGAGGLGQLTSIAIRQVHFMAGIGKGRTGTQPYSQFKSNFIQNTRSINERYNIKANVWTSVAYMSYELNERDHLGKGVKNALKRYGDPNVSTYANKVNAEYSTLFGGKIF